MCSRLLEESPELTTLGIGAILLGKATKRQAVVIVGVIYLIFLYYFYRVPKIVLPQDHQNYLLSPAYGTVNRILKLPNNRILVTIFLSPMDIHLQYFPCVGRVINQIYDNTGQFAIASDAYKSDKNEKIITELVDNYGSSIKITQIAGILVRQISTPNNISNVVNQGDYLGMIKFGSRTDIEFSADYYALLPEIQVGYIVSGPSTPIGVSKFTKSYIPLLSTYSE